MHADVLQRAYLNKWLFKPPKKMLSAFLVIIVVFPIFFLCFCSFWTQLRDELWFDSEARCALASPNENAMNQNRFLSVSLSLCFPFNIPIYTIVLDFLNIQFVSKVKRLLFPQYTKTQTGTRPKKIQTTTNISSKMDKAHQHPCLYLHVYVFEVLPMVVITFNRSFLSIFDYFFSHSTLSHSRCAPILLLFLFNSLFQSNMGACVYVNCCCIFFEFLFVCLFDLSRYTKIDRKLILKFCFDWTWCQHTIWICRLIWKFYSWERKSDLLLGFSVNSFVLSSLITKSAMHQWLPRNSI